MNKVRVTVIYRGLDKIINEGTAYQFGVSSGIITKTILPISSTVADLFDIPHVAELCEFGTWEIVGNSNCYLTKKPVNIPLSDITSNGRIRMRLLRKCDGCLLEYDKINHKWTLNSVNV